MNTYVLGSLLAASVALPAVLAWGIAHTYRTMKIILWVLWVLVVCAAGGLLSYADAKTDILKHVPDWVAVIVALANIITFFDALDSPFEPKTARKHKRALTGEKNIPPPATPTANLTKNPAKE